MVFTLALLEWVTTDHHYVIDQCWQIVVRGKQTS